MRAFVDFAIFILNVIRDTFTGCRHADWTP